MAIIDLHCHIDLYDEPEAVLRRSEEAGIYVLSVTTTPKAWAGTNRLSRNYKRVSTALGLHPQLAHERSGELSLFERLLPEAKYVGEIGLDRGKHFKQHFEIQLEVFERIMALVAKNGGRIMTIHSAYAANEVLSVLEKNPTAGPPILHWFSGNFNQLDWAIELGCWFSVGPKMFESKSGRGLIERMPLDRILFETDGPFAKSRNGKPFEPNDTLSLVRELSSLVGQKEESIRIRVLRNFKELTSFGRARE